MYLTEQTELYICDTPYISNPLRTRFAYIYFEPHNWIIWTWINTAKKSFKWWHVYTKKNNTKAYLATSLIFLGKLTEEEVKKDKIHFLR